MSECKHEFMPAQNIRIDNAVVCLKCQKFADAIALETEVEELKKGLYENMQYYMEYCESEGYVTPHDWIEKHKHF